MSIICIPLLLLLHQSYGFPLLQTFSTTTCRNLLRFKRVVRYFGVRHPHSTNSTASFQSCKLWPPMYTRTQDPSQQREVLRGVSQFPPYLFIRMCVVFQTSSLLCTPWHQNYTKFMPLRSLIPTWLSVRTSEPQQVCRGVFGSARIGLRTVEGWCVLSGKSFTHCGMPTKRPATPRCWSCS